MQKVFVLDKLKSPLMPCHPARARELLKKNKAAVYRLNPFTIILKERDGGVVQPVELKLDPGSRVSGIALVAEFESALALIWAANLHHRGLAVKVKLEKRRAIRRGRRFRKTRYRKCRFNRSKPKGWLPPSLMSRVNNVLSWSKKLKTLAPISIIKVETVRFDTQKLENPEASCIDYQQGTLFGYEVREYLLEKWGRKCAYCDKENTPLQIEHIFPKSKGGSNRVSNLTLACQACNQKKSNRDINNFLASDKTRLNKIISQSKLPLRDAAAVNSTRYAIGDALKLLGLPVSFWSGGRTKKNRVSQGYTKDHWVDAACVGDSGAKVVIPKNIKFASIKAIGRGSRQVCRVDKFGFPRTKAGRIKRVFGFQSNDYVTLTQPRGKYKGIHKGLVSIRVTGQFDVRNENVKITSSYQNFTLIQRGTGYDYIA